MDSLGRTLLDAAIAVDALLVVNLRQEVFYRDSIHRTGFDTEATGNAPHRADFSYYCAFVVRPTPDVHMFPRRTQAENIFGTSRYT